MSKKAKRRYVYRSARTGRFVSETYAKRHASTTYKDRIR